jgi:CelD/BcsL family acetyltransferase involved in cellulose biosynthesis
MEYRMALTRQGHEQKNRIRCLKVSELTTNDIAAWHELESNALEPNAFQSPHFLLPALRRLDPDHLATLNILERKIGDGWSVCAIVPLKKAPADRHIPLPHHHVYHSAHTFLGGLLVQRMGAKEHLETLFKLWRKAAPHGVAFKACRVNGPTDRLLSTIAAEHGMRRLEIDVFERAVMHPSELGEADQVRRMPSRLKKIRAAKLKLAKLGPVEFITHRGTAITDDVIERHILLEHMGWKGQNGSSLRSKPDHEKFFQEMARGFATDNRGFFSELWAGDRLIHSSSNLTSGTSGFAFKVGFDPEFSQYSPGIMGEIELMRCAPELLGDLEIVDSGAVAGSFIEDLWPTRNRMATVVYATTALGNLALAVSSRIRATKQKLARSRTTTAGIAKPSERQSTQTGARSTPADCT